MFKISCQFVDFLLRRTLEMSRTSKSKAFVEPSVTRMDVNWIVCCEDGKEPEIIGSAFKITTRVSDVPTSAAPLCERPKPLFCLRKCCCMLRGEVDDLKEALRSETICFGSLSVLV